MWGENVAESKWRKLPENYQLKVEGDSLRVKAHKMSSTENENIMSLPHVNWFHTKAPFL